MKSTFLKSIILILSATTFFSCNQNQVKNPLLPSVVGSAGELLVVIDKSEWQSKLGDTIRYFLAGQIPMVMQDEPYFDLSQVAEQNFTNIFKNHRNILVVSIKQNASPTFAVREDVYASPQIIGYVVAPSEKAMIDLVASKGEIIRNKFILKEEDRWIKVYQKSADNKISEELKKIHKFWLSIPRGYKMDVNKKDFFWISSETADYNLGVIGWEYPYTSKDQLTVENLVKKRNEVLKRNLPGPVDNSYMKTEDLITPVSNEIVYKGRYFFQMNGIWKLENAFMGGPFVSFSTVDDARKRIITVEGFVFAPRKGKRNFLRQLEGILYTLELVKDETQK